MQFKFHKYQATGNDFVIIDNRDDHFPKDRTSLIQKLCHRKFGIGSDGLILLEPSTLANFTMTFYNPDGSQSFCGNGSRAVVSYAQSIGLIQIAGSFEAYDGIHETKIAGNLIQIKMAEVHNGRPILNGTFIDTGSPHYVEFVENLMEIDVVQKGRKLRHAAVFGPEGSNINYVEKIGDGKISVRTYERGVENETLSCGTGVTASAIVAANNGMGNAIAIHTPGGNLSVWFEQKETDYDNIWLEGPAELVFSGNINL